VNPAHFLCFLTLSSPHPFAEGDAGEDVDELSLEELMNIEVTVASRSEQPLSKAPAAVYVLTGDEIRRAGHTSVMEAMRMVPGFLVGHWSTNSWDVTARGFTSSFNNNVLVMIDGVNVYDMFSSEGVRWHLQMIDLDDLDRIEVVRGPGAALWGQNAVNGVINIVTKNAADTLGAKSTLLVADEERQVRLRYGFALDEKSNIRVWAMGVDRDALRGFAPSGSDIDYQESELYRLGFRGDFALEDGATLSIFSRAYAGRLGERYDIGFPTPPFYQTIVDDTPETGGSLSAIWTQPHDDGGSDRIVASYQRYNLKEVDFVSHENLVDLDWQRRIPLSENHSLTFGLGYRFVGARLDGDYIYAFRPERFTTWNVRAFAIDQLSIPSWDLGLTLGAELENNDLTGTEFQPTARAIWTPTDEHSVWASVSRAVRTPSLYENYRYNQFVLGPATDIGLDVGNTGLEAEKLLAYEIGWRFRPEERVGVDVTAFYNDLDSLVTNEFLPPFTQGANTYFPASYDNFGSAESWGWEVGADAVLNERWRIRAAHTHFEQNNSIDAASTDSGFIDNARLTPENISNLRSYLDLGDDWELDIGLYYVDSLASIGTSPYLRTDLRLGYQPSPDWTFSVGVQNADDPKHREDGGYYVERNLWFSLSWRR